MAGGESGGRKVITSTDCYADSDLLQEGQEDTGIHPFLVLERK